MTLKQFKETLEKYDLDNIKELNEVLYDHKHLCNKKIEELNEFNFILKHYNFKNLDDLHVFINKYYNHECKNIKCNNCDEYKITLNRKNKRIDELFDEKEKIIKDYGERINNFTEMLKNYEENKCQEIICGECGDTIDENGCICPNTCKNMQCDNYDSDEENDLCKDCIEINVQEMLKVLNKHGIYNSVDLENFFELYDNFQIKSLDIGNNSLEKGFNDYIYDIRYKRKIFYHKKREDDINKLFDEKNKKEYKNDIENINIKYEKKDFIFNKTNISEIKETVLEKCKKSMERCNKLFNEVEYLYNEGIKMEKQVKTYFDKLKEKQETLDIFENEKLKELCNNYEKSLISETEFSRNIGELFVNNTLSKKDKKTFNSLNKNTRPSREITKCIRIFILEEFVSIKNIALSGVSNWIRDCSEEKFELLLSLFNT